MSLSKNITLTINDYSIKLSSEIKLYQYDQLKLKFEINEYGINVANGIKTRQLMPVQFLNAVLYIESPEGIDSVEYAEIEENAVTFYLSSSQTKHLGVSKMQIQLSDNDGCQITLPEFTFEIRKNIYDGEMQVTDTFLYDVASKSLLIDENNNLVVVQKKNIERL